MKKALILARRAEGEVLPNPMVGAVLVKNGELIGEGWHACYGGIHAEDAALNNCKERGIDPAGSDLYVTLEPCSFQSKTKHNPPCTGKIVKARISRVTIARLDPNPRVRGEGVRVLQAAGIEVVTGILENEAFELNRIYEANMLRRRPYVHLKAALTLDGFLAGSDGSSRWISCGESRSRVMRLRQEYDAVLVGRGTLMADRPRLTVRDQILPDQDKIKQPLRVILSSKGDLPENWPLADTSEASAEAKGSGAVLVFHSRDRGDLNRIVLPGETPVEWAGITNGEDGLSLSELLSSLYSRGIHSLLVEGGGRVFQSFLKTDLWDRLTVFQSPDFTGRGIPFCGDLGIDSLGDKKVLQNRITSLSGRDVEIQGDREEYPCLQD